MSIRRRCDPTHVQCIWDAIKYVLWQRLPTEHDRVVKQLIKLNGFSAQEWEKCITEAFEDNLITIDYRRDKKTEVYKIPKKNTLASDGRDWYCFECHLAGEVIFCKNKSCPRVFHRECTNIAIKDYQLFKNIFDNSDSTVFLKKGLSNKRKSLSLDLDGIEILENDTSTFKKVFDNSLCILCNIVTLDDHLLDKSELNHLLGFVLQRIKSWIPEKITHKLEGPQASPIWQTHDDLSLRASHLFFENKDMSVIDANIKNETYTKCHSFLADVLIINHNIGIFHGFESQEYQATKFVLRDTLHDLGEIIGCSDCYKHSNELINKNWFSLPCRTQHEIVWAKQKGYSYWPAKVVKKGASVYDVRFFGDKHERALLPNQSIRPISISKEALKVKETVHLLKALEELELYNKLSKSPSALEAFIESSKKEKSSSGSPEKVKSPKTSAISNEIDEKELPRRKRGRPKRNTKNSSKNPVRKRGRSSMKTEKGATMTPNKAGEKKERLSIPMKRGSESHEIDADVIDVDQTKKKKKLKRGSKKSNLAVSRITRSSMTDHKEVSGDDEDNDVFYSNDVINISDGEDTYTFSDNLTMSAMSYGDSYEQLEQVTSSTEIKTSGNICQNPEMQQLDHPYSDEVEMMRRSLDVLSDKNEIIRCAMNCMQREIDRMNEKHNDNLKKLVESHNIRISETKKKQWCFYCEQDAIYHCCWNTAYCSTTCQQQHWLLEHKKVCRRKK